MGYQSRPTKRNLDEPRTNRAQKPHRIPKHHHRVTGKGEEILLRVIKGQTARIVENKRLRCWGEELLAYKRQRERKLLKLVKGRPGLVAKGNEGAKRKKSVRVEDSGGKDQWERCERVGSSSSKADEKFTRDGARSIEASLLYIIKASPGKGLGMFAAKDIQKGTRILAEKPFFSLAKRPELSDSDPHAPNEISEAFDRLSPSDQREYMSLHGPERPGCSKLVSIYEANCYEMGPGTCICLDAARVNHSCIPNAHYSWNTNIERETLHAVKDIFKGEEITISYCSAIRTLEERKLALESYVFTCRCPACRTDQDFGIMSEARRLQMLDLDLEIADYQVDPAAAREEYGERDEHSCYLETAAFFMKVYSGVEEVPD